LNIEFTEFSHIIKNVDDLCCGGSNGLNEKLLRREKMDDNMLANRKKKKRRKRIIIAVVILAIIIGIVIYFGNKAEEVGQSMELNTDTVTERSIVNSVGATGVIVSGNSKSLSVGLSGIEVLAVNVKVGDVVKAGDALVTFDTSDIEDSLTDARESLAATNTQNTNTIEDAQRMVDDAKRTQSYGIDAAADAITKANNDYYAAAANVKKTKESLEQCKVAEENAKTAMDTAKAALDAVFPTEPEDPEDPTYKALKKAYEDAVASYEKAVAGTVAAEEAVHTANGILSLAQSNIDAANKEYNNTVANQASSVAGAVNSLENAKASVGISTNATESQIKAYEEQLTEGVLYAPISGTITALNYEVGDKYTAGSILTIQDCTDYEIEAQIGEFNIADIEVGQKVIIKTDATGDEELTGKVSFVSPISTASEVSAAAGADSSAATGASSSKYRIKITLDKQHERLRLDMSASLSIILDEHASALTVPFNAIGTDENGENFITEKIDNPDGSFEAKKIPVTVVMESNYYTEIEGEGVKVGMEILLTEEDNGLNEVQQMMEAGGF